ncbi:glycosyltransferase family 2 protein [Shewanella olleyana]|uniref:glycosyltransferase family 2 protein n=1 Tax=Shewanella olleyana TaxID=135626 RepID=UPI00200E26A4|nr:glycosyltransferase family 2 protein [Shewanella olleyana]MCL1067297.1 glycosyltransferase family 2 protein [Shewanella olleyana]
MKLPISVFIITKNEQLHLAKTLKSVACVDEIIIVDSGSTDKTLEIATKFGAKIFQHDWQGYAKQKQYAMTLCSNEWVLNLDGDEVVNPSLLSAFEKIMNENKVDSVRMWRNDIFINKRLSTLSKKANNHRFYRKSKASFDSSQLVHESANVIGKEIFINESFDHYGYDSISTITNKSNLYSTLKAEEKFSKNKQYSLLKLIFVFPLFFFKDYFLQRKFFSGTRGFILAVLRSYYAFSKEAKLYEQHQNNQHKK